MPQTIANGLQRIINAKSDIDGAIEAKGGTVTKGLENSDDDIGTIPDYKSTLTDLIERDITSIDIPDTVTSIGQYAFYACLLLESVTIPSSLTSIPANAFVSCRNLRTVTIPSSVESIGARAFYECYSLKDITIPSSVTSIGSSAFLDTGLQTITINKPAGSISGAPWGASAATIEWTG